jgi:hypothetical protein
MRFYVSVDDATLVQVGESFEDLSEYFPFCLLFFTPGIIFKKVLK